MADNNKNFSLAIESVFKGMDGFISTKTVVGEPIKVEDAIILPLVDISCGMGIGAFGEKDNVWGGMNTKMTPSAILIVQNGMTKLVNIKSQDPLTKILDMIPDLLGKLKTQSEMSKEAQNRAETMAEDLSGFDLDV